MQGEIIYNMMALMKNSRGQITSEYAILVVLIIGALVAMQVYLKRGIQARLKDAADYPFVSGIFNTNQYEPGFANRYDNSIREYEINEEMRERLAITRETTEILQSNTVTIIGNYND